jgi:hypothetical protein
MSGKQTGIPRHKASLFRALGALLLACGLPAGADTLLPYDQGYVVGSTLAGPPGCNPGSYLSHDPASTLMIVGRGSISGGCRSTYANNAYALFNVPVNLGEIRSAVVTFDLAVTLLAGDTFAWQARDVSSPAAAFQVAYSGFATAGGIALLNDLGSGVLYGSGISAGSSAFTFELVGTGLADLDGAQGGMFAIGFSGGPGIDFTGRSATLSNVRLEVSVVPEPHGAMLVLAGLAVVVVKARNALLSAALQDAWRRASQFR